jgi:diguanylate cyclase (GGDEF)-like protein
MQTETESQFLGVVHGLEYFWLAVFIFLLGIISTYILYRKQKKLSSMLDNQVDVFEKTFDILEEAILILSRDNKVVYANPSLIKLFSLDEDFRGKPLEVAPHVRYRDKTLLFDQFIQQKNTHEDKEMCMYPQIPLLLEDEEEILVNLYTGNTPSTQNDDLWHRIICIHDLRKEINRQIVSLRHQVTQLPNQAQLQMDLNVLFSKTHLNDKKLAVVLIDIDNFTMLRSIIGDEQANRILQTFSEYLTHLSTVYQIKVYHTYDNSFLLTVSNVAKREELIALILEIQKKLNSFYKMDDTRLYLTASVGVAIYPDGATRRTLLDRAYQALATAQKRGYGHYEIYMPDRHKQDYDTLMLFNEMHQALERGEFDIYYQPIATTKEKEIVSAEALIRWNHPKYGLIPPDVFIPIMEKTGFVIELGEYMLEEVLKQIKRWEMFKFKAINVSINVTLLELERKGFSEYVSKQLIYHQVHPERLKFEITEGHAMSSEEQTKREIWDLKKLGVGIALDDFGTGYTSFSYLKKFPADMLKIDKTMVDYILTNKEDQRIVKAMIDLGHSLGMEVVVEGIENKRMYALVVSYGCDYIQGYHIGKPLPVFEFQILLR